MTPARGSFFTPENDAGESPGAARPAIWAQGRQAPAFSPRVFAEAGMLLAREDAAAALDSLGTLARVRAARLAPQDWRLRARLGQLGRLLPTAPGLARLLAGFSLRSDAARRLLCGQDAALRSPKAGSPPTRIDAATARLAARMGAQLGTPMGTQGQTHPPASAGADKTPIADPDLAAIRALLRAIPPETDVTSSSNRPASRPAFSPANWESAPDTPPPGAAPGSPVLRRVMDWGLVRALAGSALVFATPLGYGRALYRHLDGADLRDIVADCHRMRIN